ncbi:hypothetical protein CDD83_7850 [Cordyceps sp. RAO-2017]|nr:hypothetical protein CDD83_7850 [Cordyceps sp. RAO-2017]
MRFSILSLAVLPLATQTFGSPQNSGPEHQNPDLPTESTKDAPEKREVTATPTTTQTSWTNLRGLWG